MKKIKNFIEILKIIGGGLLTLIVIAFAAVFVKNWAEFLGLNDE